MNTQLTYEAVDTKTISIEKIKRIFDLEQDMWARGFWEYLKCLDCEKVFWKLDYYGKDNVYWFAREIQLSTVSEIEKIFWWKLPTCLCCWWETEHIFWEEYLEDIISRYSMQESFLVEAMAGNKIVWFVDWYIETLEIIFRRELSFHFENNVLDEICNQFKISPHTQLLIMTSLWTDERNKKLSTVFDLMLNFFSSFDSRHDDLPVICETIMKSSIFWTLMSMWATRMKLGVNNDFLKSRTVRTEFETDILYQVWAIDKYRSCVKIDARNVINALRNPDDFVYKN